MADRAGTQFGPYRLVRQLGVGGFGEVYEAEDTAMNRVVALKLLNSTFSQNPVFRERLFREARTAGRLREPHVLPIHSCGEIDGQVYIDMRLVRGVDLETLIERDGPLDPARAVSMVRQTAAALDAAHAERVIHRDVKPANILLSGGDFASLVDFGLANAAGDARLTKPGTAVGSFEYIAPERLSDAPVIDHRADVYSLACVLYELLTGESPYAHHRDLPTLMNAHLAEPIPRPSQQRTGIPVTFDDVVARGMAKNPDERYSSAGELAEAAQRALGTTAGTREWTTTPATTTSPTPHQPPAWASAPPPQEPQPQYRKPRRRKVIALAVSTLVAVVATLAILVIVNRTGRSPNAAPTATARPSSTIPTTLKFPDLAQAHGVAVDDAGNVYATEMGTHGPNGRVLKLSPGQSSPTELPFGEVWAEGVAVDQARNVYLADHSGPGVWKLTPGAAGPTRLPLGNLGRPNGVAVGKDGSVYVVDVGLQQLLKLPPGASNATQLMPTTPLNSPTGVAVDDHDNVYVTDTVEKHVLKLPPGATSPTELPFAGLDQPYGIAVDNSGAIFVSDITGRKVYKLASGATSSTELHIAGLNYPFGVAIDKENNFYVVDCHRSDECATGKVLELGPQ